MVSQGYDRLPWLPCRQSPQAERSCGRRAAHGLEERPAGLLAAAACLRTNGAVLRSLASRLSFVLVVMIVIALQPLIW